MPSLLSTLGTAVLLSPQELMKLIRSAPRRYKVYEIAKRTPGQFRVIAQPAKEVKALQHWVMNHFLNQFPVHAAATAYCVGHGIADNVRPHLNSKFLLKLDFKNFFPSLTAQDFREFIEKQKTTLAEGDIEALSRILFWKPKKTNDLLLSIGAPSSPLLSNLLLMDFDVNVSASCEKIGVAYTRYADDLSFSADVSSKLQEIERAVVTLCRQMKSPKLTINPGKTVRVSKRDSRRITGLTISNDARVFLGRDQKRRIRASVHHYVTGRLAKEQQLELKGMLAYVNAVEPSFLARLRKKYGSDVIRHIQTGS
ncbi:MAG: retron St85 family RNA-directed DNA polymerase [Candidatus Solibacter sp.]|nr:retron St85 family RNA-directed DNA polymerase [Candidatus Solibacter sp.]